MDKRYWSSRIRELVPYTPGEQPKDRVFVKLNTNENPYPPSPRALEAIRDACGEGLRLYPDPEAAGLRQVILSASNLDTLRRQTDERGVTGYFDRLLGLGDIYAKSKVDVGLAYLKENGFDPARAVMIGDSVHDYEVAQALGVPESVIALTFVALGTSLPELVTAITSLVKGHGALSLGNVIGANVFNLVLVSGVSVTLAPFTIPQNSTIAGMNASLVMDIPVMFAVMLLLTVPALLKGKLSRPQGIALLCIYAAFCVVQFTI